MEISIVIPSYNGALRLPKLLDSLQAQNSTSFEVIVVLDGSTDNSAEVCNAYQSKFPNKLYVIEQSNGGRAFARNSGAKMAQNDRLLFLDDDIILSPDTVGLHIDLAKNYPEKVLFGNAPLYCEEPIDSFSAYRKRREKKWTMVEMVINVTLSNFRFSSANLSISKKVFNELNGFDERLTDSEDFDLGIRLLLKKIPIELHSSLEVKHSDVKNIDQYIYRQKSYLKSKNELLNIHPEYKDILPTFFKSHEIHPVKELFAHYIYPSRLVKHWWKKVDTHKFLSPPDLISNFHIWYSTHYESF